MRKDYHIIPAIIPKSFKDLENKLEKLQGTSSLVHIDICDGKFAESATWPLAKTDMFFQEMIAQERGMPFWEEFEFEFHLMVKNPFSLIPDLISIGASKIIVHAESIDLDQDRLLLDQLRTEGVVEVGIAFKLDTSLESVKDFLPFADYVVFLAVEHLGFQGQAFDSSVLEKVKWLHKELPSLPIAVDGGVNLNTVGSLYDAGTERFVVGSYILDSVSPRDAVRDLESII